VRLAALVILIGCSGTNADPAPQPKPVVEAVAKAQREAVANAQREAVDAQLAEGKRLFAEHCASCHGDSLQGTDDAPALVGKAALPLYPRDGSKRTTQFKTAGDVLAFAVANMPADEAGTLTNEQYIAVLAFALRVNGAVLERPLDVDAAKSITLHP
jgi:mono/diheme cytochrome c family protein